MKPQSASHSDKKLRHDGALGSKPYGRAIKLKFDALTMLHLCL
jgi:hypothetical protein